MRRKQGYERYEKDGGTVEQGEKLARNDYRAVNGRCKNDKK
jgi:hypothetical protein